MVFFKKIYFIVYIISLLILFQLSLNEDKFLALKKLTSDKYFIMLDKGLYIYNSDFKNISNNYDIKLNINIVLTQINIQSEIYISCLVNENVILYNMNNDEFNKYTYRDYNENKNNYYYLIPYNVNNKNFDYIVIHTNSYENCKFYIFRCEWIYQLVFDYCTNNNKNKRKEFNENIITTTYRPICHLNSNNVHLKCFYKRIYNNNFYLNDIIYNIYNNPSKGSISIKINYLIKIESSISQDNKIFLCMIYMIYSSYTDFIIINWSDSYIIRPCNYEYCKDVRSFYFKETNQFAYICKQNNKFLIRLINNTNGEYNQNFICNKKITININCTDNSDYEGSFALIYNDSINYFNIITDYNFTSNQKCTFSYPEKKVIINNYTNNSNITEYDEIQEEETDKIMSISDFFEEEKFDNNITENKDENANINMDPNYILENKNNIIKSIDVGETYEAQTENFKIIIKPTNITPLKNDTYIEFNECEKILREKYNMTNSSIITFFQLEIFNNDSSALINQIKYSVYDENKNELDLNLCSEVTTQIHHSLKNNSDINLSSISNFQNLGYDILNIKDKFYTDLCQSYSSSGNDMILADRIKLLYKNYSLCEQGCVYKAIDLDYNNIVCECKIEGNTSTSTVFKPLMNEDEKDVSFLDSNIGVVKCYNLVFNLRNKKNNIGFIFFSCLFIIIIIFLGMFFKKGLSPVIDYLNKEMKKYGYDIEINLNIKNKSKNKGNPNKKIIKIKKKHSNDCLILRYDKFAFNYF